MMASEDDRTGAELAELKAELARFVLREAGAAAAETPELGLGAALKDAVDLAVRESLEKALRSRRDLDPSAFAERVLRLAEAQAGTTARAAAVSWDETVPTSGWAQFTDGCRRRPLGVATALVVLITAVFAAGWFARDRLAPAPAAASSAAAADPEAAQSGTPAAAQNGQQSAQPSGQPAVLNGVELSNRPKVEAPAGSRSRPAPGGRAR